MNQFILNRETMKQCSKCRGWKPITDFYKDKGGKYGVKNWCKRCYCKKNAIANKKMKTMAIAIYKNKCQNKECPYPDINTDSKYLQFHHIVGSRRKYGRYVYLRVIKNGIQDDIELLCAPCHVRADIRDGTFLKGPKGRKKHI